MNIFKKIFKLQWKQILPLLKQAKTKSGYSYFYILKDLYKCFKQGYTWVDYFAYDFVSNQKSDYRESFITINRHYPKITKIFNQKNDDNLYFDDKGEFNRNFKDFRNIDCLDLRVDSYEKFCDFLAKHQSFFAKEAVSCGGYGVKFFSEKQTQEFKDIELFNHLKSNNLNIVEERVIQHQELSKLSINSLNTLRVITIKDINGVITIPFVASRISINDAMVDNASSGGAFTLLDDNGTVVAEYMRYLPKLEFFKKNPITGFEYIGFKFPFFNEAKTMCLEASKRCENHFIGWDVAITEKGPILIEANNAPTPQLFQTVNQLKNGKGHLETLEKAFKVKLK